MDTLSLAQDCINLVEESNGKIIDISRYSPIIWVEVNGTTIAKISNLESVERIECRLFTHFPYIKADRWIHSNGDSGNRVQKDENELIDNHNQTQIPLLINTGPLSFDNDNESSYDLLVQRGLSKAYFMLRGDVQYPVKYVSQKYDETYIYLEEPTSIRWQSFHNQTEMIYNNTNPSVGTLNSTITSRDTLYYKEYYENVDLLYNVTNSGYITQWFILKSIPQEPTIQFQGEYFLSFTSRYQVNISMQLVIEGGLANHDGTYITNQPVWFVTAEEDWLDDEDQISFEIGTPIAVDKSGASITGQLILHKVGNNYYIEKIFPASWILDPNRQYPLYCDASVLLDGSMNRYYMGPMIIADDDAPYSHRRSIVVMVDRSIPTEQLKGIIRDKVDQALKDKSKVKQIKKAIPSKGKKPSKPLIYETKEKE